MNDGDVEVFLALVERHRTYMYNLALRLTGNAHDAKDVVQDSLAVGEETMAFQISALCLTRIESERPMRMRLSAIPVQVPSAVAAVLAVVLPMATGAQGQTPGTSFDVVSIKRNVSGSQDISINAPNGTAYNVGNTPMRGTIMRAYQVKNLAGMPAWVDDERYDITAKSTGRPDANEVSAMLRTMLTERLKLTGHIEPREMSVFALVVSRPGHPGLKPVTLDCDAVRTARDAAVKAGQTPVEAANGAPICNYSWFGGAISSGGIPLQTFAGLLDYVAGRVVVDQTRLTGRYEFTLRFTPPGTQPVGNGSPDFFTAIQEQLGLRLDATRAPVDTFVIDHIERPTEN